MKLLSIFLILLLASAQVKTPSALDDFAKAQSAIYSIDTKAELKGYAGAVTRLNLHSSESKIALKSRKAFSVTLGDGRTMYSRIELYKYEFDTKEKCLQAGNALLACFPNDCQKIIRGADGSAKITPSVVIFGSQTIVIAVTNCESADEKWADLKKEFVKAFAQETDELIETGCGGLKWTTKEKIVSGL